MKKIITPLAFAFAVIVFGFGWSHLSVLKKMELNFGKEKESEGEEDEGRDATGMIDMFNKMRNNQYSDSIPLDAFYQAVNDAKQYAKMGYRGGLNLSWQSMGPDNQGGRSRSFLIDRNNPNRIFCGSVSGGLWVSNDAGVTWNTVPGSDQQSSLIISCIVQAKNGNIYYGTGEYFGYEAGSPGGENVTGSNGFPGNGIWESTDDGNTFTQIKSLSPAYASDPGDPNTADAYSFVTCMAVDPTDSNRIYIGLRGSSTVYPIRELYTSGDTFAVKNVKAPSGFAGTNVTALSIAVAPNGTVHATIETGDNVTASYSMAYYRQTDSTKGFVKMTSLAPVSGTPDVVGYVDRMSVAVSPQTPNYVYAIESYVSSGNPSSILKGIWRSTDGGTTFTEIEGESVAGSPVWMPVTQGFYALALEVNPLDSTMIIFGGIDVYRWDDAEGAVQISNWNYPNVYPQYVHADIHSFRFVPHSTAMYVMSDGGMGYTTDVTATDVVWSIKNYQYITTQCYDVVGRNYTGEILMGTQDNGTWYLNFQGDGNDTQFGRQVQGGDGGTCAVSTINPQVFFAQTPNGALTRSSNAGNTWGSYYDDNIDCHAATAGGQCSPTGEPDNGAPFITPYKLWENLNDTNPQTQAELAVGTGDEYPVKPGNVWITQDPLNLVTTPQWFNLTINHSFTAGGYGDPVSALAFSSDGKTIFAGTESGNLYRIDGIDSILHYSYKMEFVKGLPGLQTVQQKFNPDSAFHITTTLIKSYGQFITDINVDNNNKNHVIVTLGNYGNAAYVSQTHDAVKDSLPTFAFVKGTGLPLMPVYCCLIDKKDSNTLVIGTEMGVYASQNGGTTWTNENNGTMPNLPVFRLYRLVEGDSDDVILAATFGRGIFKTSSLEYLGVQNVAAKANPSLNLYPNPASSTINLTTTITALTDAKVSIYSMDGKLVKQVILKQITPGVRNEEIDVSNLAEGAYILNMRGINTNLNLVSKFMVVR